MGSFREVELDFFCPIRYNLKDYRNEANEMVSRDALLPITTDPALKVDVSLHFFLFTIIII